MKPRGPDPGRTPSLPRERRLELGRQAIGWVEVAFGFLVDEFGFEVTDRAAESGFDWLVTYQRDDHRVDVHHDEVELRVEVEVDGLELRALVLDRLEAQGQLDRERTSWLHHLARATGIRGLETAIAEHGELLQTWAPELFSAR